MGSITISTSGGKMKTIACFFTYNGHCIYYVYQGKTLEKVNSAWRNSPFTADDYFSISFGNPTSRVTFLKPCTVFYFPTGAIHKNTNEYIDFNLNTQSLSFIMLLD